MLPILSGFVVASLVCMWIYRREVARTTIRHIAEDGFFSQRQNNLMLGSSSIRRLYSDRYLACGTWLNRGIGAALIASIERYLRISPLTISPANILLYAGENDISEGGRVESIVDSYTQLIGHLRDNYPQSNLHVIAIKPSPSRVGDWSAFC